MLDLGPSHFRFIAKTQGDGGATSLPHYLSHAPPFCHRPQRWANSQPARRVTAARTKPPTLRPKRSSSALFTGYARFSVPVDTPWSSWPSFQISTSSERSWTISKSPPMWSLPHSPTGPGTAKPCWTCSSPDPKLTPLPTHRLAVPNWRAPLAKLEAHPHGEIEPRRQLKPRVYPCSTTGQVSSPGSSASKIK